MSKPQIQYTKVHHYEGTVKWLIFVDGVRLSGAYDSKEEAEQAVRLMRLVSAVDESKKGAGL